MKPGLRKIVASLKKGDKIRAEYVSYTGEEWAVEGRVDVEGKFLSVGTLALTSADGEVVALLNDVEVLERVVVDPYQRRFEAILDGVSGKDHRTREQLAQNVQASLENAGYEIVHIKDVEAIEQLLQNARSYRGDSS